jgi:hypothetical protein
MRKYPFLLFALLFFSLQANAYAYVVIGAYYAPPPPVYPLYPDYTIPPYNDPYYNPAYDPYGYPYVQGYYPSPFPALFTGMAIGALWGASNNWGYHGWYGNNWNNNGWHGNGWNGNNWHGNNWNSNWHNNSNNNFHNNEAHGNATFNHNGVNHANPAHANTDAFNHQNEQEHHTMSLSQSPIPKLPSWWRRISWRSWWSSLNLCRAHLYSYRCALVVV